MISSVAESYQIHPQTLRLYERLGLLTPSRSDGNTRLYTDEDLQRLEVILTLTRELGVNLAGVEVILNMREKMEHLQKQVEGQQTQGGGSLSRAFFLAKNQLESLPVETKKAIVLIVNASDMCEGKIDWDAAEAHIGTDLPPERQGPLFRKQHMPAGGAAICNAAVQDTHHRLVTRREIAVA